MVTKFSVDLTTKLKSLCGNWVDKLLYHIWHLNEGVTFTTEACLVWKKSSNTVAAHILFHFYFKMFPLIYSPCITPCGHWSKLPYLDLCPVGTLPQFQLSQGKMVCIHPRSCPGTYYPSISTPASRRLFVPWADGPRYHPLATQNNTLSRMCCPTPCLGSGHLGCPPTNPRGPTQRSGDCRNPPSGCCT